MNRGSETAVLVGRLAMAAFNEAPIHESGKSGPANGIAESLARLQ